MLALALLLISASGQAGYHPRQLLVEYDPAAAPAAQGDDRLVGAQARALGRSGLQVVELPEDMDPLEALAHYRDDPAVRFVEPDYRVRAAAYRPNDPEFSRQWHLQGDSRFGDSRTGGLDWLPAWDAGERGRGVVVAVLDTGVDYRHPDLAPNICPGARRCDPANLIGWNFVGDNADPMDDSSDSHGTHVAGIIGAVAGNGEGVAGIAPAVRIMPVKFLDADGEGYVSDAVRAIDFAIEHGADIINLSYGYPLSQSRAERAALERARAAGILVVTAAGNGNGEGVGSDNDRAPYYPASHRLDNVIAVAASAHNGGLASFSNYGRDAVHLAAPGAAIVSTVRSDHQLPYGSLRGTSMAAPMVSGIAALLLAAEPDLSPRELRERILLGAERRAPLTDRLLTEAGARAWGALTVRAEVLPPLAPSRLELSAPGRNQVELSWLANSTTATGYHIERRRGDGDWELLADWLPPGQSRYTDARADLDGARYSYRVVAVNAAGASAPSAPSSIVEATGNGGSGAARSGSSNGDPRCFIASAAYGSPLAAEVQLLRDFRDRRLLTTPTGALLVEGYYRASPPVAAVVEHAPLLRWWLRAQLGRLIAILQWLPG